MGYPSTKEISSLLTSRYALPRMLNDPPHRSWSYTQRAALVILWGLLVYPLLDTELQRERSDHAIHVDQFIQLFQAYVRDRQECVEILLLLKQHDYIRWQENQKITVGTGLLASIDAAKMYGCFRSSLLARQLFQQAEKK